MILNKSLLSTLFVVFFFINANAQFDSIKLAQFEPALKRQLFHDKINAEQKMLLASDGKADGFFSYSVNDDINVMLTTAIKRKVDELQYVIEKDTAIEDRLKVNYLRGIENMLYFVRNAYRDGYASIFHLPIALQVYEQVVEPDYRKENIAPYFITQPYEVTNIVLRAGIFDKSNGFQIARTDADTKYIKARPDETLRLLKDNMDIPARDSLIRFAAHRYPKQLYDYAQSNTKLGETIRLIQDDSLISTVVKMSQKKNGQQLFPFLDNLVKNNMSMEEVEQAEADSIKYYKLLVKTHLQYLERAVKKDTAFAYKELEDKMRMKAREVFVSTINGLHTENDGVRFKILQSLNSQELYYVAILSDGEIYTSSYVAGVYPRMIERIGKRGDSLLKSVYFDNFRRFIAQAAAYNTLNDFLKTFPKASDANVLMRAFVSGLERTTGVEEGVYVADSYASIYESNKKLAKEILSLVQMNYEANAKRSNANGMGIYNILYELFQSADSTKKIDLTKDLGIPPVYNVPFNSITNEKGEVICQVFFYGDKDGQNIFRGFINMFDANWKIDLSNKQWATIKSIKGKPVIIYANKPLPEETGEDDRAQQALNTYLRDNGLYPTITIHRGHSYYANSTIKYMSSTSRIVFMGSCGGFHLIDDIIKRTTDAHIIASKQIGKTAINRPFFDLLMSRLRNGKDIDWIPFWKEFKGRAGVEGFEDYIPPYKNLGAIYIKAYNKMKYGTGEE